jgi:acyl-CoA synthetase (AMP-forming)/AMP-acid ligase II
MTASCKKPRRGEDVNAGEPMSPQTLIAALESAWQQWADRPALVCSTAQMTYGQFAGATANVAEAYRSLGVGHGERVVCAVSNRPEHLVALAAAWSCGAVHVTVDQQSTAVELSSTIERTQARVLVWEPGGSLAPVESLRSRHPGLHIVAVTAGPIPTGCLSWLELVKRSCAGRLSGSVRLGDPAIVFLTSGTTGRAKATVGFHGNLAQRWPRLADWLTFGPDDVHLVQMPLSHGFGLMMAMAALLTGGRLILVERFAAEEVLRLVASQRVTVLNGAPAHFRLILNCLDAKPFDVSSLRLSVGTAASFAPSLVESIWNHLGVRFMLMYGSAEGVGVATTDPEDVLRGSVGRPAPGSVSVVGPDRQQLAAGEVGELAFSRRTFPVKYWDDSESPDGDAWYYSGDLGRLDDDGRLYVLGRLNDRIDRGGLKIDPLEVENALLRCSGIADAAVIGRPNPILGETVCACIVPVADFSPELASLQACLRDVLAPYKIPEEFCVLKSIPRTRIGKVDRVQLQTAILTAMSLTHARDDTCEPSSTVQ